MTKDMYNPEDFGKKEVALKQKYDLQKQDAMLYFKNIIKPRLDRSYKLYVGFTGDRAKQIKRWQANVFVPYTHAVVETLKPRILDARPEFSVQGRTEDDQAKAGKQQQLQDYNWEIAEMDSKAELLVSSSMIFGNGYLMPYWKKDVREHKFFAGNDINSKRPRWTTKKQTFYDAPFAEWVDNYELWYDWRNVEFENKQFWFRRKILTGAAIKQRYPMYDKQRLELALKMHNGDLTDYAAIRNEVKLTHEKVMKGEDLRQITGKGFTNSIYEDTDDPDVQMHEVFEWTRPFDDRYSVMVNDVPVLKGAEMPIAYDFKEMNLIVVPYLRLPGEFEGYGIPLILENPQVMLNMIKNQRIDAASLNIHKMWVVNPLANINKEELVTRPFGIVYSTDPNGVREIQFSDLKASAYKEEELLKGDMRYASGVDDASMGSGSSATSATEVRHLRESTLERVRLFVNHLGDGFARLMRLWMSMHRQFYTKDMTIRIVGDDGNVLFPLIEKDDLMGQFDYKASVLPSIAGMNDVKKKQDMDLFQLLINLPFVDPRKLTGKVLHDWNWNLESISRGQEDNAGQMSPEMQQMMQSGQITPEVAQALMAQSGGQQPQQPESNVNRPVRTKQISPDVMQRAQALLGKNQSSFGQLNTPINLLMAGGVPPTVPGAGKPGGANPRGMNRGGKVNTNISLGGNANADSSLMNRSLNIQR